MRNPLRHGFRVLRKMYKHLKLMSRKKDYSSKVFCIGYNKTGTTSLGKALQLLGYRHSSYNRKVWREYYKKNKIVKILEYTARFDSFDDLPWLKEDMIPILDKVFPNSKFIFLTRDDESWKKSFYNWTFLAKGYYPDMENSFEEYKNHQRFVMKYFEGRPDHQFLVLNIQDEKGFKKLADFLGKQVDEERFPHYNKTDQLVKTRKQKLI